MAKRKFSKLKARMFEQDISQQYLAKRLGKGITYLSRRLNAHEPFTTEDMQAIGLVLEIPRDQWLDYFIESA